MTLESLLLKSSRGLTSRIRLFFYRCLGGRGSPREANSENRGRLMSDGCGPSAFDSCFEQCREP